MSNKDLRHNNELRNILDLVFRRRLVIFVPFILIFSLVSFIGLYLPNLYRSSTSIFIEPQEVPKDYVRSTVTTEIEGRIRTITQQLTNRTKLLQVISELDLYPEEVRKKTPNEALVKNMRKHLEVEIPTTSEQNFFIVYYLHEDPSKAMLGVSSLVALFIKESLLIREEQAIGTTRFIEEELESSKKILEKQEESIQYFKKRHMGELPNQLEANLKMLDNLHIQLSDNLESQRGTKNRLILYEQELALLAGQLRVSTVIENDNSITVDTTLSQLLIQRDVLLQEINGLESNFTQHHPDLIAAKKELVKVEVHIRAVQKGMAARTDDSSIVTQSRIPNTDINREMNSIKRRLNDDKARFSALEEEERNLRDTIKMYQKRVEAAPRREQQLLSLSRDYENTKQNYQELLDKKLEAQLSENLERSQKGEKFRILDPANMPERPFLPNRIKIILMGLFGGLGLGVGIAFLLESFFPAFHDLTLLKNSLDAPIVMAIPHIVTSREKRRRTIRLFVRFGVSVGLIIALLFLVDRYVIDLNEINNQIGHNLRSLRI